MEKKWDGKTKGSLFGYRFFVFCIQTLGVRVSYFFCLWVSGYFILFAQKQRNGLIKFYQTGLNYSKFKSIYFAVLNFYRFGQVLIDRIALKTNQKKKFKHTFDNEQVLLDMNLGQKGGFLISGHIGNWENAGNLISERITSKINILMLDAEVEKIKEYLELQVEKSKYKLIPLKEDLSHLILIHQALKRNELIALHADRTSNDQKNYSIPFLNGVAQFPAGPFIMAHKFKVPITFVFAIKSASNCYHLSATEPLTASDSAEEIATKYVQRLEEIVLSAPEQWFNFYDYYAN